MFVSLLGYPHRMPCHKFVNPQRNTCPLHQTRRFIKVVFIIIGLRYVYGLKILLKPYSPITRNLYLPLLRPIEFEGSNTFSHINNGDPKN